MKKIVVIGAFISLHSGTVVLSVDQARSRRYALDPLGDGIYAITAPIGFKRGEVFAYDGPLPKNLLLELEVKDTANEDSNLKDMDIAQLLVLAGSAHGLSFHPRTGKKKVIEAIEEARAKEREAEYAKSKSERITFLESLGEDASLDELAELELLKKS
ncbi:hypothetical protein [Mesoterricola silvestris]|uniref:Uncharacterized protein n=1 Tax=Mesoterricola silvestris TaxID=2927979 RepID=A0AA48GKB3_9BACT|nr:hypothetical protein [Mesoterricola silvestris]BDU72912.1 hypothetical protein METEAL_20860 [Mesoterricola silvestris]